MSTERYLRERFRYSGKGPNGRNLCRWCGTEVQPPRQNWCGKECVDEYTSRKSSSDLRRVVFRRDHGVCAMCGLDTNRMKRIFDAALTSLKWMHRDTAPTYNWHLSKHDGRTTKGYTSAYLSLNRILKPTGWNIARKHHWDADHIVPVVEGGGQTGAENARTLCCPCHKAETAKLARRRAQRRRDQQRGLLDQPTHHPAPREEQEDEGNAKR